MSFPRSFAAMLALLALGGCDPQAPAPETTPPPVSAEGPYLMASGDCLRIIVFGQDTLSNGYCIDGSGMISMPLIGRVRAQGLTAAKLEKTIEARLRQGYLREPSVSVEVEAFRPFFVLGAVNAAGQYPFVAGLTAQKAVAVAGGFGPHAIECCVDITRTLGGSSLTFSAPLTYPIKPGDTLTVRERVF